MPVSQPPAPDPDARIIVTFLSNGLVKVWAAQATDTYKVAEILRDAADRFGVGDVRRIL